MPCSRLVPLVMLAWACGPPPATTPTGGGGGARDSGGGVPIGGGDVVRPTNDAPPTADTPADVLARVFDLGREPSIPGAFGALRPGMTRAEAVKARPREWGEAWEHALAGEPGVTLHAGAAEGTDDPLGLLMVTFDQWDARARLVAAWGTPDATAYNAATACWLAPGARLKACQLEHLDRQAVELGAYQPLADALAPSSPRALGKLIPLHGATLAEVKRAFPRGAEITSPDDPAQHRYEVPFPATEYLAEVHPDRVVFWIDRAGRVGHIYARFGANDPALRPALVDALRAAVAAATGMAADDPSVALLESEPIDVVVVIDRDRDLE